MYQFFSSLPDSEINKRYLSTFRLQSFNKKFDSVMRMIPELNGIFLQPIKGSQLLTFNFYKLTNIYYSYIEILDGLPQNRRDQIQEELSSVFNYSSHRLKIRNFLSDPNNGYEIHNCMYCDIHPFHKYHRNGNLAIDFHVDHVLDEGKCPLVGLSIHNFVPSCPVCNEGGNKGTQTLGRTKKETLKISPKSRLNNFDKDVEFYFTPSCDDIKDLKMFRGNTGWEIDFRYSMHEYYRTIELFHLKERYDAEKKYFGDYIYKRINNPDPKIKRDAELLKVNFIDKAEELFELEKNRRNHKPMEKCRTELIKQVYGFLPGGNSIE